MDLRRRGCRVPVLKDRIARRALAFTPAPGQRPDGRFVNTASPCHRKNTPADLTSPALCLAQVFWYAYSLKEGPTRPGEGTFDVPVCLRRWR